MFLHFIVEREHKEAFMELAHRIAKSDGFVNRNELNYIQSWTYELGLEDWEPSAEANHSTDELVGNLQDEQLKHIFLAEMLLLIFADGNYNDEEKRIACEMQQLFGYDDETFNKIKNWVEQMNKLKVEGMKLILHASAVKPD
ncbi:TerB family tellurite resistance protein [Paenibacillus sp. GSMTC-2017]|uniref:TerB family tellurite resistance protein n=1 Tax=Paenibacillus sp. GSMTC-2017 TaxID=2794350 RepID=UPI0018D8D0CD|nr:TerB family tellurite resistance protein [Paenibacillus sp. GSMTC-2017]MBH5320313.1 TerB family tellurite resistance protein [Paenibacillus sp. GSMTC-2017]